MPPSAFWRAIRARKPTCAVEYSAAATPVREVINVMVIGVLAAPALPAPSAKRTPVTMASATGIRARFEHIIPPNVEFRQHPDGTASFGGYSRRVLLRVFYVHYTKFILGRWELVPQTYGCLHLRGATTLSTGALGRSSRCRVFSQPVQKTLGSSALREELQLQALNNCIEPEFEELVPVELREMRHTLQACSWRVTVDSRGQAVEINLSHHERVDRGKTKNGRLRTKSSVGKNGQDAFGQACSFSDTPVPELRRHARVPGQHSTSVTL